MTKSFDLPEVLGIGRLPKYLKQVEQCTKESFNGETTDMGKAVQRLLQARGKRLRPALVIASAELSGQKINDSIIKAAAAVELIHIASLVHDDIIDKALTRWNIPTINAEEGLDNAILGGDFLFAKACSLAAEANQEAGVIAAETIIKLCSGQSAELATQYDVHRTQTMLMHAIGGKTAALTSAACQLGGVCAGLPKDKTKSLSKFGHDFGMSFQLIDDVLDFISTDELLGKPVGNDIKEGIYNLPVILGFKSSVGNKLRNELKAGGSHQTITQLLIDSDSISATLSKADKFATSAEKDLKTFGKNSSSLAKLPANYINWALSNLVAPRYKNEIL